MINSKELEELSRSGQIYSEDIIISILDSLNSIIVEEDNLLFLNSVINVIGDVHGQLFDVFEIFNLIKEDENILFLGDFVDRGEFSIETFIFIAQKKLENPKKVFLLRGNHESIDVNSSYGLKDQIITIYGNDKLFKLINETFKLLPIAAVIDNKYFCCHAGLSPNFNNINELFILQRNVDVLSSKILSDLLWSDPDDIEEFSLNSRGSGYIYGEKQLNNFLKLNNLEYLIRSHQLAQEGYTLHFNDKCITIWSAPNYGGGINKGKFLKINSKFYDLIEINKQEIINNNPKNNPSIYFV